MKKLIIYGSLIACFFAACEDVYIADIDDVGNVVVADARIAKGSNTNYVVLTQSQGFNNGISSYPGALGGKVTLLDNEGNTHELPEHETGKFYVDVNLVENREYKIRINHAGNIYESAFEKVPVAPDIDTVYGISETQLLEVAGDNDADDILGVEGVQLYADIKTAPEASNYRFTAEKVLEYIWAETLSFGQIMHFYWSKSIAGGIFNIAAPPKIFQFKGYNEASFVFFKKSVSMEEDTTMAGWIVVLYQHAISKSSYSYYNDLNDQLDSEGRIFDPVFVQARSNLKCLNNEDAIILGNFEISSVTEHRYFIRFIPREPGFVVVKHEDRSPIPWSGETIDIPPGFWAR